MVNAYNPCILLHWQANMDIQMVGGPLGIAYYICSYVCKAEPNILKNALAQTPSNMNTANAEPSMRSRLSKIGFCILKHRGSIPYWKFNYNLFGTPERLCVLLHVNQKKDSSV